MIKNEYEKIKIHLSAFDWRDGNEYNSAKNDFIKQTKEKALEWFVRQNSSSQNGFCFSGLIVLIETFEQLETLVLADILVLRNPLLRHARKRCR